MSVARLQRYFYEARRPIWIDSTTAFAALLTARATDNSRVLSVGAGNRCIYRVPGLLFGIDPDRYIAGNTSLRARVRGVGESLPFKSDSFDLVFMDWVVEHLPDPLACAREIFRVLQRGGHLVFRTGNLYHYAYFVSRVTPHRFHEWVSGEEAHPFPTFYRMNTAHAVRQVMSAAGFVEEQLVRFESDPAYLGISALTYLAGVAYERMVNRFEALTPLRAHIHGCFRKP